MARGYDNMDKIAERVVEGFITVVSGAVVGGFIHGKKKKTETKLKKMKAERSELSDTILKKVANKKKIKSLDKEILDFESKFKR